MASRSNQALYDSQRWRRRRRAWLRAYPLCVTCKAVGRIEAARVCDHVVPHRGDLELFHNGEIQGLCLECHNNTKQQMETKGYSKEVGTDGWPVDPRHPINMRDRRRW
jgi:hypothetical protein